MTKWGKKSTLDRRIAEVEEVADLVCYLSSPRAHFVNGTMIEIDGGQMKPVVDSIRDQL